MSPDGDIYRPDLSLRGKLRRRVTRLQSRNAAVRTPLRPMVSFAFDDAPASAVNQGGRILERRGLRGTYFVAASLAGAEGHMGRYASPDEIRRAAAAGHEIACHTYSHLDCGQADETTIQADLDRNRETLQGWGLPAPQTFAYPFGDVSAQAKRAVAGRFRLSRALHPRLIGRGVDLNQAPAVGVEGADGEARGGRWLQRLATEGGWLILFTHGVEPAVTEFGASEAAWERLVDDGVARGFEVVTVAEGARRVSAPVLEAIA